MGGNCTHASPTRASGRAAIGLLGLLGACSLGSDPDPRRIAVGGAGVPQVRLDEPLAPAVGSLAAMAAMRAPAPAVETRLAVVAARQTTGIAVGVDAAAMCDAGLVPAFASEQRLEVNLPACSDREVIDLLNLGRVDFGLISGELSPHEVQAGLVQSRLGVELFALTVAPDCPLRSLSRTQVRQVLTGEIRDWQKLGLPAGPITLVAPSDRALGARAARALIPGDDLCTDAVRVASERHVVDQLLQKPGAIGIVRLTALPRESGQKLVPIDWVAPSLEAFAYGTYPFGRAVQLITAGAPRGVGAQFLEFARSPAGERLLARTLSPLR